MMECNRKKQLLGKSIRKIRMRRNMTQRALAKATDGISESALRSYELGERSPKRDSLERNNMENTRLAKLRLRNIKTGKGNIRQTNRRMNQGQMIPF